MNEPKAVVTLKRGGLNLKIELLMSGKEMTVSLYPQKRGSTSIVFAVAKLERCHLDRYEDWSRTLWLDGAAFELLNEAEMKRVTETFVPLGLRPPIPKAVASPPATDTATGTEASAAP